MTEEELRLGQLEVGTANVDRDIGGVLAVVGVHESTARAERSHALQALDHAADLVRRTSDDGRARVNDGLDLLAVDLGISEPEALGGVDIDVGDLALVLGRVHLAQNEGRALARLEGELEHTAVHSLLLLERLKERSVLFGEALDGGERETGNTLARLLVLDELRNRVTNRDVLGLETSNLKVVSVDEALGRSTVTVSSTEVVVSVLGVLRLLRVVRLRVHERVRRASVKVNTEGLTAEGDITGPELLLLDIGELDGTRAAVVALVTEQEAQQRVVAAHVALEVFKGILVLVVDLRLVRREGVHVELVTSGKEGVAALEVDLNVVLSGKGSTRGQNQAGNKLKAQLHNEWTQVER